MPNAVHAGIYRALAAGYYRRRTSTCAWSSRPRRQDTLKLIDAGRAQFGLADGSDVAGLIDQGGDAQAVMALVQRPLGGLIALASEHLRSPADLAGRTVGITGVPSDTAVLDTELRHAGVRPRAGECGDGRLRRRAGARGRQDRGVHRASSPPTAWRLQVSGHPITAFALDRNGGPAYPGLVAFTTRALIASDPALVRGFVAATVHGYEDTLADPARSLQTAGGQPDAAAEARTAPRWRCICRCSRGGWGSGPVRDAAGANIEAMSSWMGATADCAPIAPARYGTNASLPGG